jgi:hypothetical protein
MTWTSVKNRFRSGQGDGQSHFVLPRLVLEIEPSFVVGASLDTSARALRRIAMCEMGSQTINPVPNANNIANIEELRRAVTRVTELVGEGSHRVGLLVPDGSVRVVILTLETLAEDPREADTLVRWRMKETLPYPPEEAKISHQVLWNEPNSVGMLVVAARNSMLAEYEQALGSKNGGFELILPATVALLPLLPETETQVRLLVHVCSGGVTSVVVQGSRTRSWRTQALVSTTPEEMVRDVSAEVARVLASTRDRLNIEVEKVLLCARPPARAQLARELGETIAKEIQNLVPEGGLGSALSPAEGGIFDSVGAPIAGLLTNLGA